MPLKRTSPNKALLRGDLPDNFTRGLYRLAPYRGCAHGCLYCDGRAERYFFEGEYEKDIDVRVSIPEALEKELPALREEGMVVFGSGTTDPYQPCEAHETITGRAARLLACPPAGLPRLSATLLTKSSLIEGDRDAWLTINENRGFVLLMSITSIDESLREWMEPGASSFEERFRTLKAFKEAGCATGVLAMPLLPGLSDSRESVERLFEASREAKVDFVMPGGLTLRPGRQKDLYLRSLEARRPDLLEATRILYREERASGAPLASSSEELRRRTAKIGRDFQMPFLLPHRIFATLMPAWDSFRILLRDMGELYPARGIETGPLQEAASRYDAWLLDLRRHFRRHRSLPREWLGERFDFALVTGELERVLDNPRLSSFAHAVIAEGARLDYLSLELQTT
ncbi:MAG: radical SAM protein [Spirochaetota bacterium]